MDDRSAHFTAFEPSNDIPLNMFRTSTHIAHYMIGHCISHALICTMYIYFRRPSSLFQTLSKYIHPFRFTYTQHLYILCIISRFVHHTQTVFIYAKASQTLLHSTSFPPKYFKILLHKTLSHTHIHKAHPQ